MKTESCMGVVRATVATDLLPGRSSAQKSGDGEVPLVSQEIIRLVEAARDGRLTERGRADQFQGSIARWWRHQRNARRILVPIGEGNRILAQISSGKIDELIAQTYKGDHEKMKQAINNIAVALQKLQAEMLRMSDFAKQGQLSERAKPDQFKGSYAEIVQGVNVTLDALIGPLNVAAKYVEQIAKGDIPAKITDAYNGTSTRSKTT